MKRILPILLTTFLMVFLCVGNAMAFNWTPGTFVEEDDGPFLNSDYVDPGWGGQEYDVERLGISEDATYVYFGLQTGFDLTEGKVDNNYAGDFALDTDGNGTYDHAIDISYSSGLSMHLYTGGTWQDPDSFGIGQYPFQMADNTGWVSAGTGLVTDITHSTSLDSYNLSTHILTGRFLKSDIAGYSEGGIAISWTMQCGNDVLQYPSSVPEPATMLLLGTGLIGLAAFGRKRVFK